MAEPAGVGAARPAVDRTTRTLSAYAGELAYAQLAPENVLNVKRHLIDSVGCAIGGFAEPPAVIARALAADVSSRRLAAGVLGEAWKSSPELAAFANGVMIRCLDFNDARPGGHPSDGLGALLGLADALGTSGRDLVTSIFLLYEVFGALNDAVDYRERGWDQGTVHGIAVACAAGKLLGLDEAIGEAVTIAASESPATRQARAGELSMWKGCATASAARNGVFAALLAEAGMTGPRQPFEGRHGFWEQVSGPFALALTPAGAPTSAVDRTWFKYFPIEANIQSAASAALQLRRQADPSEIESLSIATYWRSYSETGAEPEKWAPTTRETADHSMPYVVASVLRFGTITLEHFSDRFVKDEQTRQLMAKISVRHDERYTEAYPARLRTSFDARLANGRQLHIDVSHPRGHTENPMTDDELVEKFRSLSDGRIERPRRDRLLDALWSLEEQPSVGELFALARQTR